MLPSKFEILDYFRRQIKHINMAHSHEEHHGHGHREAEQNEIGGPVLFAVICVTLAVVIIYFWAQ